MKKISEQTCQPCLGTVEALGDEDIQQYLVQIKKWNIVYKDRVAVLCKSYAFANFVEALTFANQVGELAQACDHHPAILVEWGSVEVRWWTHSVGGLHINDFILANKTDEIFYS